MAEAVLQRHQSPAGDPGGTFSLGPLRCCTAAASWGGAVEPPAAAAKRL